MVRKRSAQHLSGRTDKKSSCSIRGTGPKHPMQRCFDFEMQSPGAEGEAWWEESCQLDAHLGTGWEHHRCRDGRKAVSEGTKQRPLSLAAEKRNTPKISSKRKLPGASTQ